MAFSRTGQHILYLYAYIVYNKSMNVNNGANPIDKVRLILKDNNGILLTSDLTKLGIARTYLSILEKQGEIQRTARGVYATPDSLVDEMLELQARYKTTIFSHETALYLWDLTDRTPLRYSVTVPTGYNATLLKENGTKVFFVKQDLHLLGLAMMKSPHGNEVKSYNLERTICDVVRSRNQIDVQFMVEALKRYVGRKDKNIDLLYGYAEQLRIQKIIRAYIEVLI